jgi:mRNA interferase RelE/StbE
MKVLFNKTFLKELSNIPSKTRAKIEKLVFEEIQQYPNVNQIPSIKKLAGYNHYYRIRIGDYRIGLKVDQDNLTFERVLHRKEIYKRFP